VVILFVYLIIARFLFWPFKLGAGADRKVQDEFRHRDVAGPARSAEAHTGDGFGCAGANADHSLLDNPVATNPGTLGECGGFSAASHAWPVRWITSSDWTLFLTESRLTCVSKVKRGTAYGHCFWLVGVYPLRCRGQWGGIIGSRVKISNHGRRPESSDEGDSSI